MKPVLEVLLFAIALQAPACAEPPARNVDSVPGVDSITINEVPPPVATPSSSAPVASASVPEPSGSAVAEPDPDEVMKQRLLRALEEAQRDANKPKPPRPRGSGKPCAASDPLCD